MSIKTRLSVGALTLSLAGTAFIMQEEGTVFKAYLDPVGVPTICTGSTKRVFLGHTATLRECEERLQEDTSDAGKAIARYVQVRLTQGQYDALLSFVFNVGQGNFSRSTLLRHLNAGECHATADQFKRWVYAKGIKLRGLVKRRAKEAEMFREGCA